MTSILPIALYGYLAGVVLFLFVIDEPLQSRFGIAAIWPISIGILGVVIVTLLLTASVFWWPVGVVLAALVSGALALLSW